MEKDQVMTRPVEVVVSPEAKKFAALVRRTQKDKPRQKDVEALRCHLEAHPELWRIVGDVAQHAFVNLVDVASGDQESLRASLKAGQSAMREELGFPQASALERLLIDRVILCWLRLHHVEFRYTAVVENSIPLPRAYYWERRLSAAQHRYLQACESLARIRKLIIPIVQVNIGEKQVNIADTR